METKIIDKKIEKQILIAIKKDLLTNGPITKIIEQTYGLKRVRKTG